MSNVTFCGELGGPCTLPPFYGSGIGVLKLSVGRTTWAHCFQNCFPQPSIVILMARAMEQRPQEHLQVILSCAWRLRQVVSTESILKCGPCTSGRSSGSSSSGIQEVLSSSTRSPGARGQNSIRTSTLE